MASFNFTERLKLGFNGSRSINTLLANFVTAIAGYIDTLLDEGIDTDNLADGAITADKIGTGAVTSAKIGSTAVTGNKITATALGFFSVAGADSSADAVDLTATGMKATNRIVSVVDSSFAVVDKSWFTVGADKITQAAGHDLDAVTLLFIYLVDETV